MYENVKNLDSKIANKLCVYSAVKTTKSRAKYLFDI